MSLAQCDFVVLNCPLDLSDVLTVVLALCDMLMSLL
jgi:hypothetical protein